MPFDDDFDRTFKRMSGLFVFWFIFCALMSVATLGFIIWLAVQILEKVG